MADIFTPQQLTSDEIRKLDSEFWAIEGKWEEMDKLWLNLHDFFSDNDIEKERKYFCTYFRWYAELCWHMKEIFGDEFFAQNMFGRLFTVGILLDYDPRKELMFFLSKHFYDIADLRSVYIKCRENLFSSQSIAGYWHDEPVTVASLVNEIKILNARGYNSLQVAEFKDKLKNILFSSKDPEFATYFVVDSDLIVSRFLDTINLFLGVSDDKIYFIADSYLSPNKYGLLEGAIASFNEVLPTGKKESAGEVVKNAVEAVQKTSVTETMVKTDDLKKQLKLLQDPEIILRELDRLAQERNDQTILDWYYFDEQTGSFKWRE